MAGQIKLLPKLILFGLAVGVVTFGYRHAVYTGLIPRPNLLKTVIPLRAEEVSAEVLTTGAVKALPLPSTRPASISGPHINYEIWAWNAQMGLIYANGGPTTTGGSLMEKHGANVTLKRQDDTGQMQKDLLSFAQALKAGTDNPQDGAHFVDIMGDGAAQFFAAINPLLTKLGPEYRAEIVGSTGYSRGEDKFMGLPDWRSNPQSAKGGLVVGVLRDGDWNIAMKWAAQNGIPNNPDERVYDPAALNWVNADSYTKAAEMYVAGYCEDRPVKGKSGKQHVCVNGVVTWTPGDVTVAKKRGGLVSILSTKESIFQMPCVVIGIHKWNQAHRSTVEHLLAAAFEAGDQIKTNPLALARAGELSRQVYGEETAEYWVKYFKGVDETDNQGFRIRLGGSAVSNLADNLQLLGLSGGANILKATYTTFGNIVVQQYPNLVPSYPLYEQIADASYVQGVQASAALPTNNAETVAFSPTTPLKNIEGKRDYSIQFRTGSAEILPQSYATLNQIVDDVLVTRYAVVIHGHTDSTGTPERNMVLSESRANSVKTYFQHKAAQNFPDGRVRVVPHGQDEPLADNGTEAGRAKNRRVQIVLGTLSE